MRIPLQNEAYVLISLLERRYIVLRMLMPQLMLMGNLLSTQSTHDANESLFISFRILSFHVIYDNHLCLQETNLIDKFSAYIFYSP